MTLSHFVEHEHCIFNLPSIHTHTLHINVRNSKRAQPANLVTYGSSQLSAEQFNKTNVTQDHISTE